MNHYTKKAQAITKLVEKNKTKISASDLSEVARDLKMPYSAVLLAWNTFGETGGKLIDRKQTTGRGTIKMEPTVKATYPINEAITAKEAAAILVEYMTTDMNSRNLCNKHQIALSQFYGWIRELTISGTIMGTLILDWNKYGKVEIKDVIWAKKKPNTMRKSIVSLNPTEQLAFERVSQVLEKYLTAVANDSPIKRRKTRRSN